MNKFARPAYLLCALIAALAVTPAAAQTLGDLSALAGERTWGDRDYDYASQFYAHPARLTLLAALPAEEQQLTIVQPAQADYQSILDGRFRFEALPFTRSLVDPV